MKRIAAIATAVLIVLPLWANEPDPLFERNLERIEHLLADWQEAVRRMDADDVGSFYAGDARRVVVTMDNPPTVSEGRRQIVRMFAGDWEHLEPADRRIHSRYRLGEPEPVGMPDSPLPVVAFRTPCTLEVFQFRSVGNAILIHRHLVAAFSSEPFPAEHFAAEWVDGDSNGFVDMEEQVPLQEWIIHAVSGPHPLETPIDQLFDWDENGRIDAVETRRAGLVLIRDHLRFGRENLPGSVVDILSMDDDPHLSFDETALACRLAFDEQEPSPAEGYLQRLDFDGDGQVAGYERQILGRILAHAAIRVPGPLPFSPDTPDSPGSVFSYADTDMNGVLSEPELRDMGIIARYILTETEIVSNPLERRYDSNDDFLLSRYEREAAREEFFEVILPMVFEHYDTGYDRWNRMWDLDTDGDGRIEGEELDLIIIGALNPREFFGKRPANEIEAVLDVDPENGRIEEHEVFMFIDSVFASIVQTWLEQNTIVAGDILDIGWQESRNRDPDSFRDPFTAAGPAESEPAESDLAEQDSLAGSETAAGASTPPATGTLRDGLDVSVALDPFFPVLYEYYAEKPIGKVTVVNTGTTTLRNISARLRTAQYMDIPLSGDAVSSIPPGESGELELRALFNSGILKITQGETLAAEITVNYDSESGSGSRVRGEVLRIYDRNAVRWDDDEKVAAYVTSLSPAFMRLGNDLARLVTDSRIRTVSTNFQEAMMLFDAMISRSLTYRIDPSSSYSVMSRDTAAIDYVRYPYQTWVDRVGDCDDLSVLYCTLLESVGIPSAFITTPGHIFVAFRLDVSGTTARSQFSDSSDLIITAEGDVWVPVEITKMNEGFVGAWLQGAKTWREYSDGGTAELIPTADAWKSYKAVQSPFSEDSLDNVDTTVLVKAFTDDLATFVNREIADRQMTWQGIIADPNTSDEVVVTTRNRLGWLYAYYGRADDARSQFNAILAEKEYSPALVNLGNLSYLEGRYSEAAAFYDRALAARTDYVPALLGSARAHYELENYGNVRSHYASLQQANPRLAATYGYLNLLVSDTARSQAAEGRMDSVEWAVEEGSGG